MDGLDCLSVYGSGEEGVKREMAHERKNLASPRTSSGADGVRDLLIPERERVVFRLSSVCSVVDQAESAESHGEPGEQDRRL